MRRVSIALGGVLALALCSQALADQRKPQQAPAGRSTESLSWGRTQTRPLGASAQGSGECGATRTGAADRRVGGDHTTIGSATGGAGSGIGRVNACANGKH
jgi:hypothetical protein